jgi:hypothetical protein
MDKIEVRITVFLLVMIAAIAAWSKLRHMDKEVYENPARWTVSEHPSFKSKKQEPTGH